MNFYFTSLKKNHQLSLTMINELFENLPTEIAFMILTYQPNETAVMINNNYKKKQMAGIVREMSYRFDDFYKHLNFPYSDNSDDTFYDFFFGIAIPEYVSEGFYIMSESSKPPKVSVRPDDDDDDDDDDE